MIVCWHDPTIILLLIWKVNRYDCLVHNMTRLMFVSHGRACRNCQIPWCYQTIDLKMSMVAKPGVVASTTVVGIFALKAVIATGVCRAFDLPMAIA